MRKATAARHLTGPGLMREEISYLSKRFQLSRDVIARLSILPNQRKEPPVFSARRAAELLDRSAASVNGLYRKMLGSSDTAPGVRQEINQESLAALMDHYEGPRSRPGKAKVVVIENQKGGVGKTTTMVHLAPWLALHRFRVLAIDADPQASFTTYQGINPDAELEESDTISPILDDTLEPNGDHADIQSRIRRSPHIHGLDFVPACLDLYNGDVGAYERQFRGGDNYRFFDRLKLALAPVRDAYDIILIDCPPHISAITYNAVYSADMMIVPLGAHMLDLASTGRFIEWLGLIMEKLPGYELSRIRFLVTNHDDSPASNENLALINKVLGEHLLRVHALHSAEIQRAGALLKSIYEVPTPIGSRDAWTRACRSMDEVNRELVSQVEQLWTQS